MIEYVDRRGSHSYKWDSQEAQDCLPLWVADMDFKAAPAILKALRERVEHGVFGYSLVPDDYFEAVSRWFSERHGWNGISRKNTIPTIAVVPAISATLKARQMALEQRGEKRPLRVMTFTPAYNCFFSSIANMGAELIECELRDNNSHFEIDFFGNCEDAVAKADVLLLCNPHNPTGRVWTRDELLILSGMCETYGTYIISDEIHCELSMPGHDYTPFATIGAEPDQYCVFTSASKAFNIAGLQCANIFVDDEKDYALVNRAINIHEVCDLNPFGVAATIAAYRYSADWLDEVNKLVYSNYLILSDTLRKQLPMLRLTPLEGTYLAWVNIESVLSDQCPTARDYSLWLREKAHVLFNPSEMYGAKGYLRINLATSAEVLREALRRWVEAEAGRC